jgi:poly(3-hydroxybutyrate) depolymerase
MDRRTFIGRAALALGVASFVPPEDGRLRARPGKPKTSARPGSYPLQLGDDRDGVLAVPAIYRPDVPAPLLVMLHGAGGSSAGSLRIISERAASEGIVLLAPDSRGMSWDAIRGGFGPDIEFLDRALAQTFDRVNVDPKRVFVGGFSDGATYALSIGIINGDLFSRIAAFSPGFVIRGAATGKPPVFISGIRFPTISDVRRRVGYWRSSRAAERRAAERRVQVTRRGT